MLQYHRDRRKALNIHSDGMGRVERRVHDKDAEIGGEGGTEREREQDRVQRRTLIF